MSDVTARCLISLIWTGEAKGLQTSESDHQTDPRLSQTAQTLQTTQTTHVNLHAIYLKRNLECMVINVLIYIVRTKDVKRFHMLNVTRDIVMAIDRYEMCATKDRMKMNHLHFSLPICIKIRFYNPHSSVFIRLVRNWCEPLDECAGVLDATIGKGEK